MTNLKVFLLLIVGLTCLAMLSQSFSTGSMTRILRRNKAHTGISSNENNANLRSSYDKSNIKGLQSLSMSESDASRSTIKHLRSIALSSLVASSLVLNPMQQQSMQPFHNEYTLLTANAVDGTVAIVGKYSDPFHPQGFREVTAEGDKVTIRGTDDGDVKNMWVINAVSKKSGEILVDFSPKGGPKDLLGKYSNGRIEWPDGNAWTKVSSK